MVGQQLLDSPFNNHVGSNTVRMTHATIMPSGGAVQCAVMHDHTAAKSAIQAMASTAVALWHRPIFSFGPTPPPSGRLIAAQRRLRETKGDVAWHVEAARQLAELSFIVVDGFLVRESLEYCLVGLLLHVVGCETECLLLPLPCGRALAVV